MLRSKYGSLITWAVLGCLFFSMPVAGEEPAVEAAAATTTPAADKALEIPQIEVLAHKEKAATSSIITKEDISEGPYMNTPGFMREQSGIDLTRRSLLGVQNSQMRLRGFDESRYQVYINGRTWKGAGVKGGFYVDWSTITLADLERLEVNPRRPLRRVPQYSGWGYCHQYHPGQQRTQTLSGHLLGQLEHPKLPAPAQQQRGTGAIRAGLQLR